MAYTVEDGYEYVVGIFARYHGMSLSETRDYFEKAGIVPYIKEFYLGLSYGSSLESIRWLRNKLERMNVSLPRQKYFSEIYAVDVPVAP